MEKKISITVLCIFAITLNYFAQQREIDSLQRLLKTDKEDTNKVFHLNELGWLLMNQNPDTAILLGKQALGIITPVFSPEFSSKAKIIESDRMKYFRSNILGYRGAYYYSKADYSNALDNYLKSLKIAEEINNKNHIATRLGNIGIVYSDQGDYSKALEYYFTNLKDGITLDVVELEKSAFQYIEGVAGNIWKLQKTTPTILDCQTKAYATVTALLKNFYGEISIYLDDIKEIKLQSPEIVKRLTSLEATREKQRGMWVAICVVFTVLGALTGFGIAATFY